MNALPPESDLADFIEAVKGNQTVHPLVKGAAAFAILYTLAVGTFGAAGTGLAHVLQSAPH